MSDAQGIIAEASALAEQASALASRLDYEAREVCATMDRIQQTFADQQPGQQAVQHLFDASDQLGWGQSALLDAKADATTFVARLRS